jgi:hypothetical protein
MQTSLRAEPVIDAELLRQARFWRLCAALSVPCTLNVFLGIVAMILAHIAGRAAERGDAPLANASLRWARLLTLFGIVLSLAAAAAAAVALVLAGAVPAI